MVVSREPFAVVVGRNCELLRNLIGVTQDELARYARRLGLKWKASSVGDFEAGRSAPKFTTVVTVAFALQWALEDVEERDPAPSAQRPKGISLATLMMSDGQVMMTDTFRLSGSALNQVCRGYVTSRDLAHPLRAEELQFEAAAVEAVAEALRRGGLTEDRQAKRLGIAPALLAALSLRLWGRTFSAERDSRAGVDANPQKRGRITREMHDELQGELPNFRVRGGELARLAEMKVWADGDD